LIGIMVVVVMVRVGRSMMARRKISMQLGMRTGCSVQSWWREENILEVFRRLVWLQERTAGLGMVEFEGEVFLSWVRGWETAVLAVERGRLRCGVFCPSEVVSL
jgi:hypothetical protein